jgi:Ca2+-binding RTX toxin-like protein
MNRFSLAMVVFATNALAVRLLDAEADHSIVGTDFESEAVIAEEAAETDANFYGGEGNDTFYEIEGSDFLVGGEDYDTHFIGDYASA